MSRRGRIALAVVGLVVTAAVAWVLFIALPRWTAKPAATEDVITEAATPAAAPTAPVAPARPHIKARLFYLTEDGLRLQSTEQEVEFGETTAQQARRLVEAQLLPPAAPLVSAIPTGTTLRDLFVTDRGEAFVDLSSEISRNHSGGSLDEILTVYTLVSALTENLPAVTRVQILVDGHEVDTLAGHVDLRRPLRRNLEWIQQPAPAAPPAAGN
jgi:spore germination protein GerM